MAEFGDIAITTMVLHDRFEIEDRAISETYRSFCVFRRHGPAWLWLGGQTCVAGLRQAALPDFALHTP